MTVLSWHQVDLPAAWLIGLGSHLVNSVLRFAATSVLLHAVWGVLLGVLYAPR